MRSKLELSYRHCEEVARRSGSNFYLAFRSLPRPLFRQMCVLYAFMRQTDDLGDDETIPLDARRQRLQSWRKEVAVALSGASTEDVQLAALKDVCERQQIPAERLLEVVDGVESDLSPGRFETFPELERYCYQVAGVVGLCCLSIWGYRGEEPREAAIACGTAFQLTNILRDLKEDAERGRLYLPTSELDRFGYSEADLSAGLQNAAFTELMEFQVQRAWTFYEAARPLQAQLSADGRRIFLAFFDLYSSLLRRIEECNYDVFSQRISLSRWKKARVALRCWLRLDGGQLSPIPRASCNVSGAFDPARSP